MTAFSILRVVLAGVAAVGFVLGWPGSLRAGNNGLETAILAGGCFWCVEADFEGVPGVVDAVSGYTGGHTTDPTYREVVDGDTGHLEAVKITYDPSRVSYDKLLSLFWRSIDPTDAGGQFCDRGESYTTAIFATSDQQQALAEASKQALATAELLPDPIVTPVLPAKAFYPAEDYHQDYHTKNPYRYKIYRFGCGRDRRIKALWGDEAWVGQG